MAHTGGKYAKGIAKREEILTVALRLVAERGYNAATIRELAESVGLSKTGLLHHFGTKEDLFTEILRRRDALDEAASLDHTPASHLLPELVRRNADVPGLVQMYTRFSSEATEPRHGAHGYFTARYDRLRTALAALVVKLQESGRIAPAVDASALGTVLVAAMDGLQIQWLYDPTIDMSSAMAALFDALLAPVPELAP